MGMILKCWRSYRESTYANMELTFGNNSCLEADDPKDLRDQRNNVVFI